MDPTLSSATASPAAFNFAGVVQAGTRSSQAAAAAAADAATLGSVGVLGGGMAPLRTLTSLSRDGPPQHMLRTPFTLYFSHRDKTRRAKSYEELVQQVATFNSIEDFWHYYTHISRPSDLMPSADYHLFKEGIKPVWEDDLNRFGGKWILRLRKGLADRMWENLVLAVLGDQFEVGNEICGAVVSIRAHEDLISVWNRTANRNDVLPKIRETIKRVLDLPATTVLEYKSHDLSLKDNSSYRNTDVFR
eukprot:m.18070 g.18070  ORF g.18070 m.18070 type:complete len:247 (+) comp5611_c1_seq1:157-897(+)